MSRTATVVVAVFALTLALTPVVYASDIKVTYLVDAKAFKAAIAGTPLTFSLFTDASCAGAPTATEIVNAEATQLLFINAVLLGAAH